MSTPPIVLYINFYTDKSPSRQQELVHCQRMNGQLESIDQIYMVVDDVEQYKRWKIDYPKIQLHLMSNRPTFTDFFKLANQTQTHPKQINIIANTDIYFTPSLDNLKTFDWKNRALCLSRQDTILSCSQDVWAWQGSMKNISSQSSFFLGILGCDNRIAYVLHSNGYELHNPAKTIIANHVHSSMVRNYTDSDKLQGEFIHVEPTYLGEHTDIHFTIQSDLSQSRSSNQHPKKNASSRERSKSKTILPKSLIRSRSIVVTRSRSIQPLQRNYSFVRKNNIGISPAHTKKNIKTRQSRSFYPITSRLTQLQHRIKRIGIGRKIETRRILTTTRRRR